MLIGGYSSFVLYLGEKSNKAVGVLPTHPTASNQRKVMFRMGTPDCITESRRCSKCGQVKAVTEFYKAKRGRYQSWCKACKTTKQPRYEYRPDPEATKICNVCKRPLPASDAFFHLSSRSSDGLNRTCKECRLLTERESKASYAKRMLKEKGEELNARRRDLYAENPQKHRDAVRRYRLNNPEKVRVAKRIYEQNNKEKVRLQQRNYRLKHPEYAKVHSNRRRARKLQQEVSFTSSDWNKALEYFDHKCAACGKAPDFWTILAADHWVPLSAQGATTPTNIIPLCHSSRDGVGGCNNSKHSLEPEAWLVRRFGERKAKKIKQRIEGYFLWLKGGS